MRSHQSIIKKRIQKHVRVPDSLAAHNHNVLVTASSRAFRGISSTTFAPNHVPATQPTTNPHIHHATRPYLLPAQAFRGIRNIADVTVECNPGGTDTQVGGGTYQRALFGATARQKRNGRNPSQPHAGPADTAPAPTTLRHRVHFSANSTAKGRRFHWNQRPSRDAPCLITTRCAL